MNKTVNPELKAATEQVREKLKRVVDSLKIMLNGNFHLILQIHLEW